MPFMEINAIHYFFQLGWLVCFLIITKKLYFWQA